MLDETWITMKNKTTTTEKEALYDMIAEVKVGNDAILAEGDEVEVGAPTEKTGKRGIDITRAIEKGGMKTHPVRAIEAMILKGVVVAIEKKSAMQGMAAPKSEATGPNQRVLIQKTITATTKIAVTDRTQRVPESTTMIAAKTDEIDRIVPRTRTMTTTRIAGLGWIKGVPTDTTRIV